MDGTRFDIIKITDEAQQLEAKGIEKERALRMALLSYAISVSDHVEHAKMLASELIALFEEQGVLFRAPDRLLRATALDSHGLTESEQKILGCLVRGLPNKAIAHELDITESTVKVHLKGILRKLRVWNRTQAALWAQTNGFGSDATPTTSTTPKGESNGQEAQGQHVA